MLHLLWLVPLLPLLGFTTLVLFQRVLSRTATAIVGVGSVGLSCALALTIAILFLLAPPTGGAFTQTLWIWMHVGDFAPGISLRLDTLSLVMMLVVTVVGFFIHLYSAEFMAADGSYLRFFAYMNLFVASMLVLVLAGDLLFLFLGWEGVGLCSYLLIAFWHEDPYNCVCGRKAFIVTRIGDVGFLVALLLIFTQLGSLDIHTLMRHASAQWPVGSPVAIAAAALLLAGALGKSAQVPLQTWLPEAMAGPTPVSALIHAATMVTAGMYLIARTHTLFELAPPVLLAMAIIGVLTLLISGFSALAQNDIKRILAYSTISQIGYMFLALGVGAWAAAIFHFMAHAFFKALLFLSAGVVIQALDDEHDIHRMGGLRTRLPAAFWSYLIGSASLAALPLITAGFYSKDLIIASTWSSPLGGPWLWAGAVLGAFLTSIYIFRSVFIAFFGEPQTPVGHQPRTRELIALTVLSIGALVIGFLEIPDIFGGGVHVLSEFLQQTLPPSAARPEPTRVEWLLELVTAFISIAGIYLAYRLFLRRKPAAEALVSAADANVLRRFWGSGFGFDWVYYRVLVWPYGWFARVNRADVFDVFYNTLAAISRMFYGILRQTQSGNLRWYMGVLAGGGVVLVAIVVLS